MHSLYSVLNFRGITSIFSPAVWHLNVPPRIHVFLWPMYNNRLLTRDNNHSKRRELEDKTYLFCNDDESVNHLFFVVLCEAISDSFLVIKQMGTDFESITIKMQF